MINQITQNRFFIIFIVALICCGCVGIGAPILSPALNAENAEALLKHGRPLPAEKLIDVTIKKCKAKNDEKGLAIAYTAYAGFLQSSTVAEWEKFYRKNGFMDPEVTFENRIEKAYEYWQRALTLYIKIEEYAGASNVYINLVAFEFYQLKNKQKACEDLALSLQYNKKFTEKHPKETVTLPKDFKTFDEYIVAAKKQLECE